MTMDEAAFVRKIADKLNHNQRNAIASLNGTDYEMLGCAEDTARRLCRDGIQRPALVQSTRSAEGPVYRLTALGVLVKHELNMRLFVGRSRD